MEGNFNSEEEKSFAELVLTSYPFQYEGKKNKLAKTITEFRFVLPDKINMFDRLFQDLIGTASVQEVQELFPPKNVSDLLKLVALIESGTSEETKQDQLKQVSLLYYIVLDLGKEVADGYAKEVVMPESYQHFIGGCHALDRGEIETAVSELIYPGTASTYPDVVVASIDAVARFNKNRHLGDVLVCKYFTSSVPHCVSASSTDIYVAALGRLNPMSALTYIRAMTQDAHEPLFQCLVTSCIDKDNKGGVWKLSNLPFTRREDVLFSEALRAVCHDESLIDDVLVTRSLHLGDIRQAKDLVRDATAQKGGNERWLEIEDGLARVA